LHTCYNGDWHLLSDVMRPRRGRDVTATFHELRRALFVAACVHGGRGKAVKAETCDNQTTSRIMCVWLHLQVQSVSKIPHPHKLDFSPTPKF
jgi:hypothetical protein